MSLKILCLHCGVVFFSPNVMELSAIEGLNLVQELQRYKPYLLKRVTMRVIVFLEFDHE